MPEVTQTAQQTPDTLPADFFSQQQAAGSAPQASNPDTLPADFFSKQTEQPTQPQEPTPQASHESEPGLVSRAYETSGAKGTVDLGKAYLSRPIDLYHEAVDAFKKGDYKSATETANKLVSYAYGGYLDKDSPLVKAAEEIIMHPIREGAEAIKAAKQGDKLGAVSHGAASIPLLGAIGQSIAEPLAEDIHKDRWSAVAGDILGPLLTMGVGKVLGGLGEAGEEASSASKGVSSSVRPGETEIAGVKVPVASNNPNLPGSQSMASKVVSQLASKQGAKDFVAERVQPAATEATQANFSRSAVKAADQIRALRGEPSLLERPPVLRDVHEVGEFLRKEAKGTYQKLDEVSQQELADWETQYGEAAKAEKGPTLYGPDEKPIQSPAVEIPPKPKVFSELKDQINEAEDTLRPGGGDNTAQSIAKQKLPELRQEMQDFLDKHGHIVADDELKAADSVWKQSRMYDWIEKKIRSAGGGNEAGRVFAEGTKSLRPSSLRNLSKQFDNRYGDGSWQRLLGKEGVKNFNDVLSALDMPAVGGSRFWQWLSKVRPLDIPLGEGVTLPASWLADNLLFNPEFGQRALRLWRLSGATSRAAGKAAATSAAAGMVVTGSNNSDRQRRVYAGAASSLGN
jgi:hypothetical protein